MNEDERRSESTALNRLYPLLSDKRGPVGPRSSKRTMARQTLPGIVLICVYLRTSVAKYSASNRYKNETYTAVFALEETE
jgi:hypothetical protein